MHPALLYSVKVTDPPGASPPVSVAVSFTVLATPTVTAVGLATVLIPGADVFTVSWYEHRCSSSGRPSLSASPG